MMSNHPKNILKYDGWISDLAALGDDVYLRKAVADRPMFAGPAGCLAIAVAGTYLSWIGLSGVWLLLGMSLALLVALGCILLAILTVVSDEKVLRVDNEARMVSIEYERSCGVQRIRFEDVQQIVARHIMNGRGLNLEFILAPEASVAESFERRIPEADVPWQPVWDVRFDADDIAAWVGCTVEHDYRRD